MIQGDLAQIITQDITTAISTVGFPIACCIMMFRQQVKNQEARHVEFEKFQEALNNNTLAVQKLVTLIEMGAKKE